jgi:hypothetical protein
VKGVLSVAFSCGLAYALSAGSAVLSFFLTRLPAPTATDQVMRGYGVAVVAALAGLAFTAAVALTPRRATTR